MYSLIRGAQNWVKARFKNFSEEYTSFQNGGVGKYDNVSKVYSSEIEPDAYDLVSNNNKDMVQHHNINISNYVHLGGKALRANTTTDHLVNVSGYGKLYKQRGLLNHESQMRIMEDDTPWQKIEGQKQKTRNLGKLMATQIYSDDPRLSPDTATELGKILMGDQASANFGKESMQNQNNKSAALTKDIMLLLGFTDNEVKYLESKSSKNNKQAQQQLAELKQMVVGIDQLSNNEKLQMRNELIIDSSKTAKPSGDLRSIRNEVIVNPKIIEFMQLHTSKNPDPEAVDQTSQRKLVVADPENKLESKNLPMFVRKTPETESLSDLLWNTEKSEHLRDTSKPTASYKHLEKYVLNQQANQREGISTQQLSNSMRTLDFSNMNRGDNDYSENLRATALDNEFGENRTFVKHTGPMGNKSTGRNQSHDLMIDHLAEVQNQRN
jgi:hypothetical protein